MRRLETLGFWDWAFFGVAVALSVVSWVFIYLDNRTPEIVEPRDPTALLTPGLQRDPHMKQDYDTILARLYLISSNVQGLITEVKGMKEREEALDEIVERNQEMGLYGNPPKDCRDPNSCDHHGQCMYMGCPNENWVRESKECLTTN